MKEKKNGNKQMPKLRPKREGEKSGNGARAGLRALRAREELRMVAGAVGLPIHAFAL